MQVDFNGRNTAFIAAYQYDYGQRLEIKGLELSDSFEMHFDVGTGTALVVQGNDACVEIPDEFLAQSVSNPKAWLYIKEEGSGTTVKTVEFHIISRDRPCNVPPLVSVGEIKGYADYVKENADKVTAAEQIAADLKLRADSGEFNGPPGEQGPPGADGKDYILTQQDRQEIANMARIGALTIKTASDDENLEEQLLYLYENLAAVSPCLIILLYDAQETQGISEGGGLFIIDSGSGVLDDAYVIPYCSNEISYTYADKDRIDTSFDFANSYPEKTRWKELKVANNAQVSYADGTALSNMKIREVMFSLTIELLEDFAAQRYSAFGIEVNGVSRIIEMPRIFEQPNSSLTVNAHIILHQNGYILKVLWCNDERTVTTIYDIPGSKNFGLWDISTMYVKNIENDADYHLNKTLNYIYGRC